MYNWGMHAMMQNYWGYNSYGPGYGHGWEWFLWFPSLMIVLVIWSLVWKGWALWLAARRGEKIWFGVLLVLNTIGILDIIYIFLIAKRSDKLSHHNHS